MQHSLTDIRLKLRQDMVNFLWRQWSALGVAGQSHSEDHWVIDPEALLLVSTEFARYDARLFDEILDWLLSNGNLINLKRVFNIRKQYPIGNPDVLLAIAKKLSKKSSLIKWKTVGNKSLARNTVISEPNPTQSPHGLISLFPKTPWIKGVEYNYDKEFQEKGFYRPPFQARGMSQAPSPSQPTNLIFKMRAVFGCNSRAEILTWLLTHNSGHPAQIARDTHYFNKSVQSTLNEMASSGLVHITKSAREKNFRINRDDWLAFYGNYHQAENPPQWLNWAEIFSTIHLFHQTLKTDDIENASELLQAFIIQQAMEKFPFTQSYLTTSISKGSDYLDTVLSNFSNLSKFLNK